MPTQILPPAIMIQGTSSNAGKSLLAAALCRMYARKGYTVYPFKSQNMTSSLFQLPDGNVMSSAQALQAIAAQQQPDAMMNPVLLKPCSMTGSEIFLHGRSQGVMSIAEYTAFKKQAFAKVQEAYTTIAAKADLMILEGAGSPAEINLKAHDIANMQMARFAQANVLLTGDIDRGGVFAHLLGTYMLLEPEEQQCIAAFILNKFRGDASLLSPALEAITQKTGIPFAGVVPYVPNLNLPEEDSLSLQENTSDSLIALSDQPAIDAALNHLADIVENSLSPTLMDTLATRRQASA